MFTAPRTCCWSSIWSNAGKGPGLEHLVLRDQTADSVVLAIGDDGQPFRLTYRLVWDSAFRLREAHLVSFISGERRTLELRADGQGSWWQADGAALPTLEGCIDIDIWPTPLTNSLPIWRSSMAVAERREFRMAWISAPEMTVASKPQAYTCLDSHRFLFESLDDSGFSATLVIDDEALVVDYPGLFRRVQLPP